MILLATKVSTWTYLLPVWALGFRVLVDLWVAVMDGCIIKSSLVRADLQHNEALYGALRSLGHCASRGWSEGHCFGASHMTEGEEL